MDNNSGLNKKISAGWVSVLLAGVAFVAAGFFYVQAMQRQGLDMLWHIVLALAMLLFAAIIGLVSLPFLLRKKAAAAQSQSGHKGLITAILAVVVIYVGIVFAFIFFS